MAAIDRAAASSHAARLSALRAMASPEAITPDATQTATPLSTVGSDALAQAAASAAGAGQPAGTQTPYTATTLPYNPATDAPTYNDAVYYPGVSPAPTAQQLSYTPTTLDSVTPTPEDAVPPGVANPQRYGGYNTETEYQNAATWLGQQVQQMDAAAKTSAAQAAERPVASTESQLAKSGPGVLGDVLARHHAILGALQTANAPEAQRKVPDYVPAQYRGTPWEVAAYTKGTVASPSGMTSAGTPVANPADFALSQAAAVPESVVGYNALTANHAAEVAKALPLAQAAADAANPANSYRYARAAAVTGLGADPLDAFGRFSPLWGVQQAGAMPTAENAAAAAQNEWLDRQANGGLSTTDLALQAEHDKTIAGPAVADAMNATGLSVADAGDLLQSPAYATFDKVAQSLLGVPNTTFDDLKAELRKEVGSAQPALQPALTLAMEAILAKWAGNFTSASYAPSPGYTAWQSQQGNG